MDTFQAVLGKGHIGKESLKMMYPSVRVT